MVYKVPESEGKIDQFEFSLPGSAKKYRVPRLQFLTGHQIVKLSGIESDTVEDFAKLELIFSLIEELSGAPIRELDPKQVGGLFAAWRDASGLAPGEADSSAPSLQSID